MPRRSKEPFFDGLQISLKRTLILKSQAILKLQPTITWIAEYVACSSANSIGYEVNNCRSKLFHVTDPNSCLAKNIGFLPKSLGYPIRWKRLIKKSMQKGLANEYWITVNFFGVSNIGWAYDQKASATPSLWPVWTKSFQKFSRSVFLMEFDNFLFWRP